MPMMNNYNPLSAEYQSSINTNDDTLSNNNTINSNPLDEVQQASDQLAILLQKTSEKARLETERINLEQHRIDNQKKLLEKEDRHNSLLEETLKTTQHLNTLIQNIVTPEVRLLQSRVDEIYKIQQTLLIFLIKEYEKLKDDSHKSTIQALHESLKNISSKNIQNDIHVIGNVSSQKDVNIS